MASRHMKRYSTSLIIREKQVKITTTLHFRLVRMAKINQTKLICPTPLICRYLRCAASVENILVTAQQFHSWVFTQVKQKPINVCLQHFIHNGQKLETTQMPINQGMDKWWYVHIVEYYSAMKKNSLLIFSTISNESQY